MAILCSAVPRSRSPRRTSTSKRSLLPDTSVSTERASDRSGVRRGEMPDVDLVADDGLVRMQQMEDGVIGGLLHEHDHCRGAELGSVGSEMLGGDGEMSFACQTWPDGRVDGQANGLRCIGRRHGGSEAAAATRRRAGR